MGRVGAALAVAFVASLSAFRTPWVSSATEDGCADTTLGAAVADRNEDGILECAPGEKLVVRTELAEAKGQRDEMRRPITALLTLADFQLPDEESPLRGEFLDKCFSENPARSAFRPQETVLGHMVNAHVRAANNIIAAGSPVLGSPIDFTFLLGDLAENQHQNEVGWVSRLMSGGALDPDTGADGYDGVQGNDPSGRGDITTPVAGRRILDIANEPFIAAGLREADGSPAPWYSVMGNHDTKVQGTVPDDMPGWREFARAVAPGPLKVVDLAPDRQQEACDILENRPQDIGLFLQDLLTDAATDPTSVGTTKVVPADPNRRLMHKEDWIDAFASASGAPRGHGFLPETQRCPDTYEDPFSRRACYSFIRGQIHYIVLDGNPAEGLDGGNIDPSQWEWLTAQLEEAAAADRLVVIASHHPMRRFDNSGTVPGSSSNHTAADLEALLLRFPNVILHLAGHSHENLIVPHSDEETKAAYWEVNTAAIADWPSQSRSVEIADNRDGTLSIHTVVFDAGTPPDPRRISWSESDPTNETAAGLPTPINESWLASLGRETAFHDPQMSSPEEIARAQGKPRDRNAELLLKAPSFLARAAAVPSSLPEERGPMLPATGGSSTTAAVLVGLVAVTLLAVRRRPT